MEPDAGSEGGGSPYSPGDVIRGRGAVEQQHEINLRTRRPALEAWGARSRARSPDRPLFAR
jgi:hypothetical protein